MSFSVPQIETEKWPVILVISLVPLILKHVIIHK